MRNFVFWILLFILSSTLAGQDMIRLQYGDSIPAKVAEVGKREIKYVKSSYLDGPVYTLPQRKVVAIEHHNGEIEKLNADKGFRSFRAGFSLSFGQELGGLSSEHSGARLIGLGHEGIIRIPGTNRLSMLYHLNLQIGAYQYLAETNFGSETDYAYYAIPALYTGIEFRQPLYKDFGLFANAQIGYMSAMFFKPKTDWFKSPYASYRVSLGMYIRELKFSVRYNTGVIEVNNQIPQIIRQGDYRLHMIEFAIAWEF